jgi:hypothetical protein
MTITWLEDEETTERDHPLERKYTQDNITAIVYPIDPHGFWKIRFDKKKTLPQKLEGSYTSIHEAEKAVLGYFRLLKVETSAKTS